VSSTGKNPNLGLGGRRRFSRGDRAWTAADGCRAGHAPNIRRRERRMKQSWARVEAVVGAKNRVSRVAQDIVSHWEARRAPEMGKGLIVCMSRRICVQLYDEIVALRPEWHSPDDKGGKVKVVITGSASDGPELTAHVRDKGRLRALKERAKDPDDPLELVIVRDMWLTGFDSPPLHTMYVDKPMRGAGLMQAIARVNRTFRDKPGGLLVDYIGIAESLRSALADYTERDRAGKELGAPLDEALAVLEEAHEVCDALLFGCPWREALASARRGPGWKRSWLPSTTCWPTRTSRCLSVSYATSAAPAKLSLSSLPPPRRPASEATWLPFRQWRPSCAEP
jgi:hypothetical protein